MPVKNFSYPMASAIFLLDIKGQSILARDYRGEVSLAEVPQKFAQYVINADAASVKPVFAENGISYCWMKQNDIYALAVTRVHANAALLMAFLRKLIELLTMYYNKLEEDTIRDNFVVTYELLDEIMDNGYPQLTEPKILRKVLTMSAKAADSALAPQCVTNVVSWRADGIKHKKNEIFVDVIERVDALVGSNSQVLRSEILGIVRMKSFLSGMPELKLGLNDKHSEAARGGAGKTVTVDLNNVRFHHCVRLNKFETDGTISFVPPDGEFELMSYRMSNSKPEGDDTQLPIWVECMLDPSSLEPSSTKAIYYVKIKSAYKPRSVASLVEVVVPAPNDASSPNFKSSSGSVKYHPDKQCFIWTLKQLQGQREQLLTATLSRPTVGTGEPDGFHKRPLEVRFEIPYFTWSGIQVRYLKIFETSGYQALPWVRYITQNGSYQVRIS